MDLVILLVAYLIIVFVLPIVTACGLLMHRRQPASVCVAVTLTSLFSGMVGFVLASFVAAVLLPRSGSHELIDWQGMLGSFLIGALIGLPLGTWTGAWGVVWFIFGRSRK